MTDRFNSASLRQMVAAVALSFVTTTSMAGPDELVKCNASARECEQQIRGMLAGKTYLGVKLGESRWGVVVTSVVPESPAALAGLLAGDRIYSVNGVDSSKADVAEFKRMLARAKNTGRISFGVVRAGTVLRVNTRLERMSREQVDKVVVTHFRSAHQLEGPAGGNH